MKKKLLAAVLGAAMAITLISGCGSSSSQSSSGANADTAGAEESSEEESGESSAQTEVPDYVDGEITIEIWHVRGSGANGENMAKVIERFNETNEYGITVVGTYMGSYDDNLAKTVSAIAAGNNPTLVILGSGGIEMLADQGVLADMAPYIERDSFDVDNIPEKLQHYMYWDDEVLTMPYIISTPVLYYNKAIWGEEVPSSMEELAEMAKAVTEETGVTGFGMTIDVPFIQRPLLMSLGGEGLLNEDGTGAGCLDDGSLETFLTDWKSWIDEGWCLAPNVTNATTLMVQSFYQGEIACMLTSTGSMINIMENCETAGVDLGVAPMVGYGGYTA
ncbi:MAG: extracellular solute-binding protein [Clostridiales bacterium]|nr:extracellular solute-binding protein [Clostridiales bacterium]